MNTTPNLTTSPSLPHQASDSPLLADWSLAQDPSVETARLLGVLLPGGLNPTADAYTGLAALNQRLTDAPEAEILESLTRQAALLEAQWLAYSRKAMETRNPNHATLLHGVALKCQKALVGVLGAIKTLSEDRRNVEALEAD